jgi:hypothetical protein
VDARDADPLVRIDPLSYDWKIIDASEQPSQMLTAGDDWGKFSQPL